MSAVSADSESKFASGSGLATVKVQSAEFSSSPSRSASQLPLTLTTAKPVASSSSSRALIGAADVEPDDDWSQWTMNGVYQRRGFVLKCDDGIFGRRWREHLVALSKIRRELRGFKHVAAFKQHVRFFSHNEEFVVPLHRSTAYVALYLDQPFAFELCTPTAIHYFSTKSEDDLREWILALADSGVTVRSPDKILLLPASNTLLMPPYAYAYAHAPMISAGTNGLHAQAPATGNISHPATRQNSRLAITQSSVTLSSAPLSSSVFSSSTPPRIRSCWGKHGYLQKRGFFNTAFKTRFFRTDENACGEPVLVYFESMFSHTPKGHVRLHDAQLDNFVGQGDDGLQFTVLAGKRLYILRAPSKSEKSQWMAVLSTLIAGNEDPPTTGTSDALFHTDFDPYDVLGVDHDATSAQIAAAFKDLAKMLHPDKNADSGQEQFMRLNEAYEILKDDRKRRWWDQQQKAMELAAVQVQVPGTGSASTSASASGRAAQLNGSGASNGSNWNGAANGNGTDSNRLSSVHSLGLAITVDHSVPSSPAGSRPDTPHEQEKVFRKRVIKRGAKLSHTQQEIQAITTATPKANLEEKERQRDTTSVLTPTATVAATNLAAAATTPTKMVTKTDAAVQPHDYNMNTASTPASSSAINMNSNSAATTPTVAASAPTPASAPATPVTRIPVSVTVSVSDSVSPQGKTSSSSPNAPVAVTTPAPVTQPQSSTRPRILRRVKK